MICANIFISGKVRTIEIKLSKKAIKVLESLDKLTKARIVAGIQEIPQGDIKPLRGAEGTFRLRVGGWRILFSYPEKNTILIEKISPRGDAYKGV